jgi:hypothetical protein
LPEASIITQGPCLRRCPGVAIRRLGFIGFPSDQKPQSLVEQGKNGERCRLEVDFLPADPSHGFLGHAFTLERDNFLGAKSTERLYYDVAQSGGDYGEKQDNQQDMKNSGRQPCGILIDPV